MKWHGLYIWHKSVLFLLSKTDFWYVVAYTVCKASKSPICCEMAWIMHLAQIWFFYQLTLLYWTVTKIKCHIGNIYKLLYYRGLLYYHYPELLISLYFLFSALDLTLTLTLTLTVMSPCTLAFHVTDTNQRHNKLQSYITSTYHRHCLIDAIILALYTCIEPYTWNKADLL